MIPHIRFVRKSPINAATLVAAGLLLTVGAPSQAQTTHAAPTAASGACVGDTSERPFWCCTRLRGIVLILKIAVFSGRY
jgi:hypothetical protein